MSSTPPFFVVGAPRTGTTLLRRLLTGHSRVAIPTESGFMVDYLQAVDTPLSTKKRLLQIEPEIAYWKIQLTAAELAPLESIGGCFAFAHEKYAASQGKDLWGQKTPKLVRHGPLLMDHFPGARFVHVVRDARAVASSLKRSDYHRQHVLYGARRYASDTGAGLSLEERHPDRVARLRYEDLVAEPERELRRLADFLGLAWEDSLLEGATNLLLTPGERKTKHHANVGRDIDRSFTDKWRNDLTSEEISLVEHAAGAVMRRLGYAVPDDPNPSRRALLDARVHHLATTVGNAVREITKRDDVWQVARRRWRLGALRRMLRDHARGM